MTKRMLIDATHAEETRVVVLDGNRLEDFDVETSTKKQLKGNIYLAKIVRVEPSLQAAFVEYGGNRHGFLAFGEIHPDYYQLPIADRQRLIAQQEQEAREAEAEEDAAALAEEAAPRFEPYTEREDAAAEPLASELSEGDEPAVSDAGNPVPLTGSGLDVAEPVVEPGVVEAPAAQPLAISVASVASAPIDVAEPMTDARDELAALGFQVAEDGLISGEPKAMASLQEAMSASIGDEVIGETETETETDAEAPAPPETLGGEGDSGEEREHRTSTPRFLRNYKIQEVMRRRQILLVQVVKEERGGKGAALTTYISLAGRFCVLMPNSPRGGGVSRKITSTADRRRLKEITAELGLPSGMGLIVRTAGAARPKPEITRDCEYLLQLWDDIRDTTMNSVAPALIYEEASLIKRAIRDVYSRDVDEVQVDGEAAWRAARDQMRLLMPSHAHKVQLWQDPSGQKLFARHQVDAQLDAMLSPNVQLRSGGYLVINQTEALVAIDVNSGRSTRERGIEETALRTNLEAAEEVARQLRLRDLAGLIVIDFIDMEGRRHNQMVEKKLAEALKTDRARIQLGTISAFGLMEMSRQRLRPSLAETSFVQCTHCEGTGHVRSTEGASIHVLRAIEEEGGKRRSAEIMVHVAGSIALYILNHKRERLREIEERYAMSVVFTADPTLLPPAVKIDKLRAHAPGEAPVAPAAAPSVVIAPVIDEDDDVEDMDDGVEAVAAAPPAATASADGSEGAEGGRRRRRRRRRGGRRDEPRGEGGPISEVAELGAKQPEIGAAPQEIVASEAVAPVAAEAEPQTPAEESGRSRRGRRGGRRRRRDGSFEEAAEATVPVPVPQIGYVGPTPADPFGGGSFDIFDALEQAEAQAESSFYAAPATVVVAEPEPEPETPPPAESEHAALIPAEPVPEIAPEPEPKAAPRPRTRTRAPRVRAAAAAAAPADVAELAEPAPVAPPGEPASTVTAAESPADAPAQPAEAPVLEEAEPAAPRRGWWRR
jgi:ribonuclease E